MKRRKKRSLSDSPLALTKEEFAAKYLIPVIESPLVPKDHKIFFSIMLEMLMESKSNLTMVLS